MTRRKNGERVRERENSKKQVPSCFWIKMLKQLDNVRGGDWVLTCKAESCEPENYPVKK